MNFEHNGEETTKPAQVIINFKDGTIELENTPLCTRDQILIADKKINYLFLTLGERLPDDHPWKAPKIVHAMDARHVGANVFRALEGQIVKENFAMLVLMAGAHDMGRVIEAEKKEGLSVEPGYETIGHHGVLSVKVLEKAGVFDIFSKEASNVMKYAIEHHAYKSTPTLPEKATPFEKTQYVFTCILRDMDKLSIFKKQTDSYLYNLNHKQREAKVNSLEFTDENLTAEHGTIDPIDLLEVFSKYGVIDRSKCRFYEAYMLQYTAWIFDVNLRLIEEEIIGTGAINKLLGYFQKQLPLDQYQTIFQTIEDYLQKQGLKLPDNI